MWIISIKLIFFFYKVGKGQKQIFLPLKWGLIHLLLYIDPIDNSFNWQTTDIVLTEISQCLYYCDYLSIKQTLHCNHTFISPEPHNCLNHCLIFHIKFSKCSHLSAKCSHLSAKSPLVVLITFLFLLFLWISFLNSWNSISHKPSARTGNRNTTAR